VVFAGGMQALTIWIAAFSVLAGMAHSRRQGKQKPHGTQINSTQKPSPSPQKRAFEFV
jgi:hypothetical protein